MCVLTSLHSSVMDYSAMHWRFLLTGEEMWFDSVILADEGTDVQVCDFVWALWTLQHVSLSRPWLWLDLWSLISEFINVIAHPPTLCSSFHPDLFFFSLLFQVEKYRIWSSADTSLKKADEIYLANCIFLTLPVWKQESVSRHRSFALFPI